MQTSTPSTATTLGVVSASEPLSSYWTEAELAAKLDLTVKTLRRWRAMGEGPSITRLGRRILYRRTTVADWLADLQKRRAV
jgi:hypothetical protein